MPPASYTARVSRASALPLVFGVCGVNLNNRQHMASAVNLDGCLIQSTFLQPFHSPSLGEIASLFVVLSAGYIHRPPVSSIFVKDCSSVLAIPQQGTGVFTIWHCRSSYDPHVALSIPEGNERPSRPANFQTEALPAIHRQYCNDQSRTLVHWDRFRSPWH